MTLICIPESFVSFSKTCLSFVFILQAGRRKGNGRKVASHFESKWTVLQIIFLTMKNPTAVFSTRLIYISFLTVSNNSFQKGELFGSICISGIFSNCCVL